MNTPTQELPQLTLVLPTHTDLYYGGAWHEPVMGGYFETVNPGTGEVLGRVANATEEDVELAVRAAVEGYSAWRRTAPLERAQVLRRCAARIRDCSQEIALLDAADGGNPVTEMISDAGKAATMFEFFAGLVTELKGHSIPMGPDRVNFSVREPVGVVARIVPFNHPFMFVAMKAAAPLAAGNALIMKAPEQAPLSSLRLMELIGDLFPPGVFNLLQGRQAGPALTSHPDVSMVGLIGSVPTGKAVMRSASGSLKRTLLELGGKNALIAFPDSDPEIVAGAVIEGMNFTWCGQSCGSTSRAFIHEDIHDRVIRQIKQRIGYYRPGIPTDPTTTMGAIINREQYDRILGYIAEAKRDGAHLLCGGSRPSDPSLSGGFFLEPTVFTHVLPSMQIATEEVFGPVLSVLKWADERQMLADVNRVPYGLTCSIWTKDLNAAHRTAQEVNAGYIWINEVNRHLPGAPFGGVKQSGIGREECIGELFEFSQEKNVHVFLGSPRFPA